MAFIRISKLFDDKNEVKVDDLKNEQIKVIDLDNVKRVIKKVKSELLFVYLTTLFPVAVCSIFVVDSWLRPEYYPGKDKLYCILFLSAFLAVSIYFLREYLIVKKGEIKKAQYGVVRGKYAFKASAKSSRHYCASVNLNAGGVIHGVDCIKPVYKQILEGDKVIVISLNGKTTHLVPGNRRKYYI